VVVLPKEPLFPDSPPAICSTCETEVPDYRRESFTPVTPGSANRFQQSQAAQPQRLPAEAPAPKPKAVPIEERRFSRGGLFKSLGGVLADRAGAAVEDAKNRFPG
jgi:hypothetical protein